MSLIVPGIPIYGIRDNGDLYWYHHRGFENGGAHWANRGQGTKVGNGWHEGRHVLKGNPRGDGVIYRVDSRNDLIWYRHHGFAGDGLQSWKGGAKVGQGWQDARIVFSGGPGVVYMINTAGDLFWFKHHGYADGTGNWSPAKKVGNGWDIARTTLSAGNGVVYLVAKNGDLFWYRHLGHQDGSPSWAPQQKIGNGWNSVPTVFSGGGGIIYAMKQDGALYWYKHLGVESGEAGWVNGVGDQIGTGWAEFVRIF